jgi:hypothetical protein
MLQDAPSRDTIAFVQQTSRHGRARKREPGLSVLVEPAQPQQVTASDTSTHCLDPLEPDEITTAADACKQFARRQGLAGDRIRLNTVTLQVRSHTSTPRTSLLSCTLGLDSDSQRPRACGIVRVLYTVMSAANSATVFCAPGTAQGGRARMGKGGRRPAGACCLLHHPGPRHPRHLRGRHPDQRAASHCCRLEGAQGRAADGHHRGLHRGKSGGVRHAPLSLCLSSSFPEHVYFICRRKLCSRMTPRCSGFAGNGMASRTWQRWPATHGTTGSALVSLAILTAFDCTSNDLNHPAL